MISNYVLRAKGESVQQKRDALLKERLELVAAISELGISKQAAWKHKRGEIWHGVNEDLFAIRNKYAARLTEIGKEIVELNNQKRQIYNEEDSDKNLALLRIFEEIFTRQQLDEIKTEAVRRMSGEPPLKVSFSVKDSVEAKDRTTKYRAVAKEQLEKMIEFRIILTGLIEKGCEKFGDAEFLRFISPLNRLIIPVAELEKIKRLNHL